MKSPHPSDQHPAPADGLVASLDGPSKTITVEPVELPVTEPRVEPEREPAQPPTREPAQPPEPHREPVR